MLMLAGSEIKCERCKHAQSVVDDLQVCLNQIVGGYDREIKRYVWLILVLLACLLSKLQGASTDRRMWLMFTAGFQKSLSEHEIQAAVDQLD